MADLTVSAAQVGLVDPIKATVRSYISAEPITKGQAVYITPAGKVGVASANAAGKQQFRGIALQTVGENQAVDICHEGEIFGFSLTGNVGDFAYLSDTAGALADAAGTMTVRAGRISVLTDKNATKVLRVFTSWEADWS